MQGAAAFAAQSQRRRPNVLFFMSDDMRVELGCYGSRFHAQTPNLDALARRGVRFDRNYCQFPLCNPSRSSLFTGRHPTTTGVLGNRTAFRDAHPDWISLPQLFRENGYASLRIGKIFHGGIDDPKAWTVGGGVAEGDGGAGGHRLAIPRTPVPQAPGDVLPPLPQDNSQAAHSDQIIVLGWQWRRAPGLSHRRSRHGISAGVPRPAVFPGLRLRQTAQSAVRAGTISQSVRQR
ncbi:hypothetical protein SBA3_3880021 [Candidatus Sulfopaludibacter sp. SbA3]|nr:hypothetical protein SBA3_3880021 [Candidatus Sulfopaludibacter sp. SbA3]